MRESVAPPATRRQFVSELTGEREGGHKEVLYRLQSPFFQHNKRDLVFFFLYTKTKRTNKEMQGKHEVRKEEYKAPGRDRKGRVKGFSPLLVPGD